MNSNKSGDMADILKSFQNQYVPIKDGEVLHKTVLHGDQLTEERARNVQWTYKNGETSEERLEGLEPTFSEFHLKMCLFEVRLPSVSNYHSGLICASIKNEAYISS